MPNHGLKKGINAISDNNIAVIRLLGVKSKIYNKIIDATKCQMTIRPVA